MEALEEAEDLSELADAVRYGVSQRETPIEATEVRVMSMHASKGLTRISSSSLGQSTESFRRSILIFLRPTRRPPVRSSGDCSLSG